MTFVLELAALAAWLWVAWQFVPTTTRLVRFAIAIGLGIGTASMSWFLRADFLGRGAGPAARPSDATRATAN